MIAYRASAYNPSGGTRNGQPNLADKAYLGHDNHRAIVDAGVAPYISFKSSSVAVSKSKKTVSKADRALWRKLFGYFTYQREEFSKHCNQRSNAESTFSSVKRKFGPALKSKTFTAQVNETYAKLLCFKLSILVHEVYELGITPLFWNDAPVREAPSAQITPLPLPSRRESWLPDGKGPK